MKRVIVIFPKDSEAIFNINSIESFGGATAQLYNIARELHNYEELIVYSLISDYPEIYFPDSDKFTFIRTFKNSDSPLKKIITYHKKIREMRPDVVIQRGLTVFSCLLAIYCKLFRIKFIFMFAHDREIRGRYQKNNKRCLLFKLLLNYTSILVVQSNFQKGYLDEKYNRQCMIVRSGYEINKVNSHEKKTILWVGRLEPWKRPEKFIRLAEHFPDEIFIMIAPKIKGYENYADKIYKMAAGSKSIEVISFVHFQEIDSYYREAKLFVNTSEAEGFPNTFVQAFKNSTPVLSLNVDPDHILEKYHCGYCCGDDDSLMSKYMMQLINDNKKYSLMSQNSFKYAEENHDIKKLANELVRIINS